MSTPPTSEWLTAQEAAAHLRVKHRTLLQWAKAGKVPAHKLSGTRRTTWRFLLSELDAALNAATNNYGT
jgi:excisionase family DNA binding protein